MERWQIPNGQSEVPIDHPDLLLWPDEQTRQGVESHFPGLAAGQKQSH